MKYQPLLHFILFMILLSFSLPVQSAVTEDLRDINAQLKKEVYVFLTLLEKIEPGVAGTQEEKLGKLRVVTEDCPIYETRFDLSRPIYQPVINQQFEWLQEVDEWYQVQLTDGRVGWIAKQCAQIISTGNQSLDQISRMIDNDRNRQIQFANRLYDAIVAKRKQAEQLYEKAKNNKKLSEEQRAEVEKIYAEIRQNANYAESFYRRHAHLLEYRNVNQLALRNRFSFNAEIMAGSANYGTSASDAVSLENKGSITNFQVNGNYLIDPSSSVYFGAANQSEIIETAYKNTQFQLGYNKKVENFTFRVGGAYQDYKDEFNFTNNFDRINLHADVDQKAGENTKIHYQYGLLINSYEVGDTNNFTQHQVGILSDFRTGALSRIELDLRASLEISDVAFRQFNHYYPSLSFIRQVGDRLSQWKLRYEQFDFENLALQNFSRYDISYRNSRKVSGVNKNSNLSLAYKTYPENERQDNIQFRTRSTSSQFGKKSTRTSRALTAYYFPENTDASFADIRWDMSVTSKLFYDVSFFARGYYPDSTALVQADIYMKLGAVIKGVKFGPTAGFHAFTDLAADEIKIEADGNNYRFGGFLEGTIFFPRDISLWVSALYDYGFVYSQEVTVSPDGDITTGELQERHPTTLQIYAMVNAPIIPSLDFFSRLEYYQIDTDIDPSLSINPVTQRDKMTLRFGLRYRYNQ